MPIFTGAGTAIVTPFKQDMSVNYDMFGKLIEFQIAGGISAIIVCGTTGEAATLTYDERKELVRFAVERAKGRVPIVAGGGSNSTATSIKLCLDAQSVGADALLCVTPYYNKTTQKGLVAHYTAIADAVDLPIIAYNVPGRTGLNVEAETVLALSKIPKIVGIKESAGDIVQTARIAALCGNDFDIYAGNCNEILPTLSLGGIGCISVLGNIAPAAISGIVANFNKGDIAAARKLQLEAIDIIDKLFCEVNPMPVKAMLDKMGYAVGECRLPLTTLEEASVVMIDTAMKAYGLS